MNKQFCGFDLGNSKVHWELSEKNALNSLFFKSKQGNELLYPVMSHIICFNSFSGTQCQICFSSNNYKKSVYFSTVNQQRSGTWDVMHFTLLAEEIFAVKFYGLSCLNKDSLLSFLPFVHADSEMHYWTKAYFILKIGWIKK